MKHVRYVIDCVLFIPAIALFVVGAVVFRAFDVIRKVVKR